MKNLALFLLAFIISIINISAQEVNVEKALEIVEEIKAQFAPDKRTSIFDIDVKKDNESLIIFGKTNLKDAENVLNERLKNNDIKYDSEITILPSDELGDKIYGIVNLSVANIRSKPGHSAELATQALLGTPVKILDRDRGFYRIQTPDDYISWVDYSGIEEVTKEELHKWIGAEKVIYESEYGFAYSQPDINSKRISDLVAGDILVNLGDEQNFRKVLYPDGRIGFVEEEKSSLLNEWLSKAEANESNILSTAEKFMGVPYLWGGTSSKGMDCSGFTKTVYFLNGVVLQRDASQQVNTGVLVDTENGFENLMPGDLLFFGNKETKDKKERITHVGIYIGNYKFIHASGKVRINSLNPQDDNFSKYRLNQFIRAKRIIGSVDTEGITSIENNKFYSGEF